MKETETETDTEIETEEIDENRRKIIKVAYTAPILIALGQMLPVYVEGGSCLNPNPAGHCPPGQQPNGWRR